jgi:hypothetical protein|tara:strand:- start:3909 stop:4688 length:780 start_codon:yes stop_codon:yes gene_type:complete
MMIKNSSEILDNGFAILPFPNDLKIAVKDYILKKISHSTSVSLNESSSLDEITNAIKNLSDDNFIKKFSKPKRNLNGEPGNSLREFVSMLPLSFGGTKADINFLSPAEIKSDASFCNQTLDLPWRCVRPLKGDVGAAHADIQFWNINANTDLDPLCPMDYDERWKVWVPLFGCNKSNSIQLIKGSHLEEVPFIEIVNNGSIKPDIDKNWLIENEGRFECPFDSFNDNCVIFSDKLVHRGPKNNSDQIRISNEFTILLKS